MRATLSLIALIAGVWLIYLGYERAGSLEGKADNALSKIGQRIDGGDHPTTHLKYYVAGAALVLGGAVGLGLVRK